jgi:hypothetical protein
MGPQKLIDGRQNGVVGSRYSQGVIDIDYDIVCFTARILHGYCGSKPRSCTGGLWCNWSVHS